MPPVADWPFVFNPLPPSRLAKASPLGLGFWVPPMDAAGDVRPLVGDLMLEELLLLLLFWTETEVK